MKILRNFEKSTKCWVCDNDSVDNDVKLKDHRHVTGKYRGFPHRDYNINVKSNHKVSVVFYNLKITIHVLLCKS